MLIFRIDSTPPPDLPPSLNLAGHLTRPRSEVLVGLCGVECNLLSRSLSFLRAKQSQSRPILIRKGRAGFEHCKLGTLLDCVIIEGMQFTQKQLDVVLFLSATWFSCTKKAGMNMFWLFLPSQACTPWAGAFTAQGRNEPNLRVCGRSQNQEVLCTARFNEKTYYS